jgi:acyl-coenzyme A synthetase/AMP-(fatty) acid ligase
LPPTSNGARLVETFLATAEHKGDNDAIITGDGQAISYAALSRCSAVRAQAHADAGIGTGDVVLVAQSVSVDLYISLLALFRLGAVAMFPEPGAGLEGVKHAIAAGRPKAMIAGARAQLARTFVPELARLPALRATARTAVRGDGPIARIPGEAAALMTFTSGSTGKSKGIVRSCDFLLLQHQLLERIRCTTPDDTDLISLPMFILSNLTAGSTSVLPAGDLRKPAGMNGARLRRQILRHRINRVIAPPALCARIAQAPCPSLAAIFTGGGPVFPDLWRALTVSAPNARICAVYGSTEVEPISHVDWRDITDADWTAMAAGAGLLAGRPIPEIALAFDNHEIEVAGPHVNRSYHDPALNAGVKILRNGRIWHRTGDCGRLDGSGRLWLLGRKNGASASAFPFAIEAAALSWPGVRQAALIAEGEHARLAVAGERLDMPDLSRRAERIGVRQLTALRAIPMDRRHNSKVDYARLRALLG